MREEAAVAQVAENGRVGRRRLVLWAALVGGIVVVAVVLLWFQPQRLLYDTTVMEQLPGAPAPAATATEGEPAPPPAAAGQTAPAGVTVLAAGEFASIAHETTGTAQLVQLADGSSVVHFAGLRTDNGPDLRVYLSAAPADGPPDAIDDDFVDLGPLKGNVGDQNYEIPADVDLSRFQSVSVWCRRFSVGFGVAPLLPPA